jgi:hypothetical protein
MVVVAVEERDLDIRAVERTRGVQSAEAAADDDDARSALGVRRSGFWWFWCLVLVLGSWCWVQKEKVNSAFSAISAVRRPACAG